MAKGAKTGGRQKGTPNKSTDEAREFVERIFAKIDLDEFIDKLLRSPSDDVKARVLLRLLEYRYGKPVQPVSGENGGAVAVQIVSSIARPRR